jgi:UDP-N-acetylglucosamine--N-acetylmuramyl-(pentapeptide) pyrophosphoryl-undecaprenol N-acetylglucosamine transferase
VIFIPFPYAIDDHQYHNAQYFTGQGNVHVFRESEVDARRLAEHITSMAPVRTGDRSLQFNAEQKIVDIIMEEHNE